MSASPAVEAWAASDAGQALVGATLRELRAAFLAACPDGRLEVDHPGGRMKKRAPAADRLIVNAFGDGDDATVERLWVYFPETEAAEVPQQPLAETESLPPPEATPPEGRAPPFGGGDDVFLSPRGSSDLSSAPPVAGAPGSAVRNEEVIVQIADADADAAERSELLQVTDEMIQAELAEMEALVTEFKGPGGYEDMLPRTRSAEEQGLQQALALSAALVDVLVRQASGGEDTTL